MPSSSSSSAAARTIRSASSRVPGGRSSFRPSDLLVFHYTPFPAPLANPATLYPTKEFAADPSHPFHLRTLRKAQAFDPAQLHWRVQCPQGVSGSGFIRKWAARRVTNAFVRALAENGWSRDGAALTAEAPPEGKPAAGEALSGALLVVLRKGDIALTASRDEVRESVQWLLDRVVRLRKEAVEEDGRRGMPQTLQYAAPYLPKRARRRG